MCEDISRHDGHLSITGEIVNYGLFIVNMLQLISTPVNSVYISHEFCVDHSLSENGDSRPYIVDHGEGRNE